MRGICNENKKRVTQNTCLLSYTNFRWKILLLKLFIRLEIFPIIFISSVLTLV